MHSENCELSWPVLPLSLTHKKIKIHVLGEFRKCLTLPRNRPCPHCHCLQQSSCLGEPVPGGAAWDPKVQEHLSISGRAPILQGWQELGLNTSLSLYSPHFGGSLFSSPTPNISRGAGKPELFLGDGTFRLCSSWLGLFENGKVG